MFSYHPARIVRKSMSKKQKTQRERYGHYIDSRQLFHMLLPYMYNVNKEERFLYLHDTYFTENHQITYSYNKSFKPSLSFDTEYEMDLSRSNIVPVIGQIGFSIFPYPEHIISYILIDKTVILLETYNTYNGYIMTIPDAHYKITVNDCKNLFMKMFEDTFHIEIDEIYRPAVSVKSGNIEYDLQDKDEKIGDGTGLCSIWAGILLKRVVQLDLKEPLCDIKKNIRGIYRELEKQMLKKDGVYDIVAEWTSVPFCRKKNIECPCWIKSIE